MHIIRSNKQHYRRHNYLIVNLKTNIKATEWQTGCFRSALNPLYQAGE